MSHQIIKRDFKSFILNFDKYFISKISNQTDILSRAMHYSVSSGGKRFRPYLVYLFGKEYNLSRKIIMDLASATEMLHNYSLVHDDLPSMDNDKYRRGKKTTHFKYNEFTAILAGCGLLTQSYNILSNSNFNIAPNSRLKIIHLLSNISGEKGLLYGQYLDLSIKNPSIKQRLEINKYKTGQLMSFCCVAVSICAKKNINTEKILKNIGMRIGEIFQINDDLNDFPKMPMKNKKFLQDYKLQLYNFLQRDMKKLNIKNKKIYLLVDYLMDLKI